MTGTTATLTAGRRSAKAAPTALRSGALMAAGSLVSRATGFVRAAVVAAALGAGYVADGYAVGNSVPTIVYMLLLGGALNAVFVPELVKAAKEHADGGVAYTDRLLTLCGLALTALTAGAVLAAPQIVDLYTDYTGPQREMTVAFARACLPQILFLGLFTLLGQVLNARGRFGAMMWTPVLNNVVVVAVFGLFLVVSDGGALTPGETALLGWGTTAGIALQALALVPSLRAAGFRWRPRFDWRGSGLAAPLRSAGWLVLLVLTNQGAYWVTTLLATSAGGTATGGGSGLAAYNNAYLLWTVPHGIITVSLVTALLPRMSGAATDGDLAGVRRDVSYALRTSAAAVVPAACALFALAVPLMTVVFRYGATGADDIRAMSWILMAFAPGLVALSGQYVCTRAFYALRDTRTPFVLNLVIAGLNALLSFTAYATLPTRWAVAGMAAGYSLALWVGWGVTAYVLRRRLTGTRKSGGGSAGGADPEAPEHPEAPGGAVSAIVRLLLAALPAAGYGLLVTDLTGPAGAVPSGLAGALTVLGVFAVLARPFRLTELRSLLTAGSGRLRGLARRT
ncbi:MULTISPECIES: murein biosynthesis integral membrane protein MurJ [unclassified Streptomyces]|uniref:murein biosynthesis integral membrane protein MurJ n=1 Tax=unclassified Streptomyces TaxID=2593676 RepID=UPI0006FA4495|nr:MULTISPECIES: murein biosynthesis integral membrane protein MurJ [unclassified Streptomyces]KQX53100.1 murein biosynthesis protein MurJ [Streptomyces sp. Root1304]KRA90021.1 murein biosynthesis protein MurJ [Streptomyces sp. Root66D1]